MILSRRHNETSLVVAVGVVAGHGLQLAVEEHSL
jgi:hypothetical protein